MSRTQPATPGPATPGIVAWGLISDVHGNLPALQDAMRLLEAHGADRLAFLGDYLGRGDADACVALIREVADLAIVGNRDLDWQDRVSPESKDWVLSLPRQAQLGPLLITHGDARLTPQLSTAEINRSFARAATAMARINARVWAFGHSHFARTWRRRGECVDRLETEMVRMQADDTYFVNVGTTGLPFPGKGGPSVALINFKDATVRHIALESGTR